MSDELFEQEPARRHWVADFIRLVGGAIIRLLYRIKVVDSEHLPKKGGALLLPNHVTFADSFFISACCQRPVRFVMDEVFMKRRSIRLSVSLFNTVTIRRDQPREAIRITIEALKNGDLVCLFPEGQLTLTGSLGELRRGFELIAKKADKPLIPLWCDGSWGSIFSFERGRFFRKMPYRLGRGMAVAFGREIKPEAADLESVRQGLLISAASAISKRFESPRWGRRLPKGYREPSGPLSAARQSACRRIWINGHQIGQINALQWRQTFFMLAGDPLLPGLLAFCELFGAELHLRHTVNGNKPGTWVGGDYLRNVLGSTQLTDGIVFYDFGQQALEPVFRAGLLHRSCLAVEGIVIAMSMPDPQRVDEVSSPQPGHKLGTWGRLLPGWFLLTGEDGGLRAHGPAAPEEGLPLPAGCFLDAEGFLTARVTLRAH